MRVYELLEMAPSAFFFFGILFSSLSCTGYAQPCRVKTGIEILAQEKGAILKGKRVGLITNLTGVDSRMRSSIDILYAMPEVRLVALFSPEHGIRSGVQGSVKDNRDTKTGLPIHSLYGATRRPTNVMLSEIDILIFDIQDIGSRSYTYISTMKLCMEEAAKRKISFIVLDRPNPLNGVLVDGPMLEDGFESFVGIAKIPYIHGMTVGELAYFFNEEFRLNCDLTVIEMQGWNRSMTWGDTGLPWIPTSPHIPEPDTPWFYPVTGMLGELSLVNIGVGYTMPFKLVAAPWIDAEIFSDFLNRKNLPGVWFQPVSYTPYYGSMKDKLCHGCRIMIIDFSLFRPATTGLHIMTALRELYPRQFLLSSSQKSRFDLFTKVAGSNRVKDMIERPESPEDLYARQENALKGFLKKRERSLLYRE
ncbi:MAG: DUF1343 domain-containing protein [Candidatus Ratteibacteria bacterium]